MRPLLVTVLAVAAGVIASRRGVIVALVVPATLMIPALPLFLGQVDGLSWLGAVLGGALGVGYSGVTPVLLTGLFDDRVRARAIGLVYHVGALFAAFTPSLIPWLSSRTGLSLAGAMSIAACGGKPTAPTTPAAPTSPTSFAGASRTWEVNNQSVDNCSFVDVQVCPEGGDIESCAAEHLRPYDCPPEGIWGSSPWHIYLLGDTCWLHGEPMPG